MENQKQPMTKAKKDMIAAIIWLFAGAIFIATGGIMLTLPERLELIFGVIILCCGSAIIGIGIYLLIKNLRLMKKEKAL